MVREVVQDLPDCRSHRDLVAILANQACVGVRMRRKQRRLPGVIVRCHDVTARAVAGCLDSSLQPNRPSAPQPDQCQEDHNPVR
jgi:hypothetical protein